MTSSHSAHFVDLMYLRNAELMLAYVLILYSHFTFFLFTNNVFDLKVLPVEGWDVSTNKVYLFFRELNEAQCIVIQPATTISLIRNQRVVNHTTVLVTKPRLLHCYIDVFTCMCCYHVLCVCVTNPECHQRRCWRTAQTECCCGRWWREIRLCPPSHTSLL